MLELKSTNSSDTDYNCSRGYKEENCNCMNDYNKNYYNEADSFYSCSCPSDTHWGMNDNKVGHKSRCFCSNH